MARFVLNDGAKSQALTVTSSTIGAWDLHRLKMERATTELEGAE